MQNTFTMEDLSSIRDAVPHLDLVAIRALRRAGFEIVRREEAVATPPNRTAWHPVPRPMTSLLQPEHQVGE